MMARMCEPRLGILIQGRIRNLGLSTTKGRFFSRSLRCPSDEVVARGELPRGGGEAEHGERPAVAVVDGVAHLGADQGLVSEIVVVPPIYLIRGASRTPTGPPALVMAPSSL